MGEAIETSSEIGTEILLYLTRTKEARYAIMAKTKPVELVGEEEASELRTG